MSIKLALEGMFERMPDAPRQVDVRCRHHRFIWGLGNVDNTGQGVLRVLQFLGVPNESEDLREVSLRESASDDDLSSGEFVIATVAGRAQFLVCSFGSLVRPLPATLRKDCGSGSSSASATALPSSAEAFNANRRV